MVSRTEIQKTNNSSPYGLHIPFLSKIPFICLGSVVIFHNGGMCGSLFLKSVNQGSKGVR